MTKQSISQACTTFLFCIAHKLVLDSLLNKILDTFGAHTYFLNLVITFIYYFIIFLILEFLIYNLFYFILSVLQVLYHKIKSICK